MNKLQLRLQIDVQRAYTDALQIQLDPQPDIAGPLSNEVMRKYETDQHAYEQDAAEVKKTLYQMTPTERNQALDALQQGQKDFALDELNPIDQLAYNAWVDRQAYQELISELYNVKAGSSIGPDRFFMQLGHYKSQSASDLAPEVVRADAVQLLSYRNSVVADEDTPHPMMDRLAYPSERIPAEVEITRKAGLIKDLGQRLKLVNDYVNKAMSYDVAKSISIKTSEGADADFVRFAHWIRRDGDVDDDNRVICGDIARKKLVILINAGMDPNRLAIVGLAIRGTGDPHDPAYPAKNAGHAVVSIAAEKPGQETLVMDDKIYPASEYFSPHPDKHGYRKIPFNAIGPGGVNLYKYSSKPGIQRHYEPPVTYATPILKGSVHPVAPLIIPSMENGDLPESKVQKIVTRTGIVVKASF